VLNYSVQEHIQNDRQQIYKYILGECRTWWGEREQAMHCGIELLCSLSFTSELSDHSKQAVNGI